MMARFPGLSKTFDTFQSVPGWKAVQNPLIGDDGNEIVLGNNGVTTPRKEWSLPRPVVPPDWTGLSVSTGTATPDAVAVQPDVPGATRPDLIVVPGQAGGGGLTLGGLALIALLLVGGWFLYKRFAK